MMNVCTKLYDLSISIKTRPGVAVPRGDIKEAPKSAVAEFSDGDPNMEKVRRGVGLKN